MRIISFTGPKGSGKDSAAAILHDDGHSRGKISFAGPMKEILSEVYRIPLATFESPDLKEKPFSEALILDVHRIQSIALRMLRLLPETEFEYTNGLNFQAVEKTRLTSPRHMLQYVGTEMIRNIIHPDWHVAAAFRQDVLDKLPKGCTFCVTDARFVNEYLWLSDRFEENFRGFYVERPKAESDLALATHPSELQVKEVRKLIADDDVLRNDRTLQDLRTELYQKLIKGRN